MRRPISGVVRASADRHRATTVGPVAVLGAPTRRV